MRAYRRSPTLAVLPMAACPPSVGSGTKSVWLRFFEAAARVECVPAPPGSHLVVFRFSEFDETRNYHQVQVEAFAALDTQLADWIPATGERRSWNGEGIVTSVNL